MKRINIYVILRHITSQNIDYIVISEKIATFTIENIVKRLHDALFLTVWNSRKIQSRVKDGATVNASLISVRFSPLPSYSTWQCEKPQTVGRRCESDPTLSFFLIFNAGEGSTRYD